MAKGSRLDRQLKGAGMRTTTGSPLIRTISQVKEIWAEFDYAQRRLLEVQLGVPMRRARPSSIAASIDELEALYRLEDPRLAD
jgi:hypothetical protein